MKRHTACRAAAFACAVVAVLALSAWCVSTRWTIFRMAQFGDSIGLKGGTVFSLWTNAAVRQRVAARNNLPLVLQWEWHIADRVPPMVWWDRPYVASASGRSVVTVILWPIPIVFSAAAFGFWRLCLRRPHPDACPRCAYRLTGLVPSTPCPECGHTRTPRTVPPAPGPL